MERVVITGASSGIGAACVEVFQREGAEVVGIDIADHGQSDLHLQMDLTSPHCGEDLVRALGARSVDGLVNSAGISLDRAAVETDAADFDRVMAVNLRAPLLLSGALRQRLSIREGFVVNIASVHAVATSPLVAAYAAAKGGLVALTRALAVEWAPQIRVNAVLPGAIDTDMLRHGLVRTHVSLDELAAKHPLQRIGSPLQIAEAVLFLATNAFATGATLTLDGGATARLSTE